MNQTKWNQLRGVIHLKTVLALSAIALAGAFVVQLPAQNTPSKKDSIVTLQEHPAYSTAFASGSFVPIEKRGPRGVTLIAGQKEPEFSLGANLTGAFVDLKNNAVINETLKVNASNNRSLIKGETYHLSAVVVSLGEPLYGLTIGGTEQKGVKKENRSNTIGVTLSRPSRIIHIESDLKAEDLMAPGASWTVVTHSTPFQVPAQAKREVTANGARFRGILGGDFVDLSDNANPKSPFVTKTLDLFDLDDAEVGYLNTDYELTASFTAPDDKSEIAFAALAGGENPALPFLMVDVDVPQKWIVFQGVVMGQKFPQTGFGWAVRDRAYFEVPESIKDVLKKEVGYNRSMSLQRNTIRIANQNSPEGTIVSPLPSLGNKGIVSYQSHAQVAAPTPTPKPAPSPTPIVVTQNPSGGSTASIEFTPSVNGIRFFVTFKFDVPYINIFGFKLGSKPTVASSRVAVSASDSTSQVGVLSEGTLNTCTGGPQEVPPIDAKVGTAIEYAGDSYESGVKSKYQGVFDLVQGTAGGPSLPPGTNQLGFEKTFLSEKTVASGHNEVPWKWSQRVSVSTAILYVTYSNEEVVPVNVFGTTYTDPTATFDIDKATSCPVTTPTSAPTPTAAPTPTPRPKINDLTCPSGQRYSDGAKECLPTGQL